MMGEFIQTLPPTYGLESFGILDPIIQLLNEYGNLPESSSHPRRQFVIALLSNKGHTWLNVNTLTDNYTLLCYTIYCLAILVI